MDQCHEFSGDTTSPGYLQQLEDLAADCARVLELVENAAPQVNAWHEGDR